MRYIKDSILRELERPRERTCKQTMESVKWMKRVFSSFRRRTRHRRAV